MLFIHYSVDNEEHIGIFKDHKIYRTKYKNIFELFNNDMVAESLYEETRDIKEEPIIKYPSQDILCLGMNYREHKNECLDAGLDTEKKETSVYFSKRCSEAITSGDYIDLHKGLTKFVDYEGELGIILKKDLCGKVTNSEIKDAIFGYCVINDVSARDLQKNHQQFYFGKSLDTFTVISSTVLTQDEFKTFPHLNIKTYVNEELRQSDNTRNMIFDIPHFIKELAKGMTLKAGTIIATGTPSGVGKALGKPLKTGDIVSVEIDYIGRLINVCK